MARVVPVGPLDAELYGFAKKEAERAERDPRYKPKNCPAERGQIVYKRIGAMVKAIVRTVGEWGQVNFASSEAAFFAADRKLLTAGKFYETRSSPAIYDPGVALELLNTAIATAEISGYSTDEHLDWFDHQFLYDDRDTCQRSSYPFLGVSDHAAYCLVDGRVINPVYDYTYYANANSFGIHGEIALRLENRDIEFYRQDIIDGEVAPELLRTTRLFTGAVSFGSATSTGHYLTIKYKKHHSSGPTPGVVDGKCYLAYSETHYATIDVVHEDLPVQWMKQRIAVIRNILVIDGVEQEIGRTTKVEAVKGGGLQPLPYPEDPLVFVEIRNDKAGKTGDSIYMAARCDGGGVYLFDNRDCINDVRAYCTLANEHGVFSISAPTSAPQLAWCSSENKQKIEEEVYWLEEAPLICNLPELAIDTDQTENKTTRYGIKTRSQGSIVLFDNYARKSLDITSLVKERLESVIDDSEFAQKLLEAKWRPFNPGPMVNIKTGLIDDGGIDGFEFIVGPSTAKDKKIARYIKGHFATD